MSIPALLSTTGMFSSILLLSDASWGDVPFPTPRSLEVIHNFLSAVHTYANISRSFFHFYRKKTNKTTRLKSGFPAQFLKALHTHIGNFSVHILVELRLALSVSDWFALVVVVLQCDHLLKPACHYKSVRKWV